MFYRQVYLCSVLTGSTENYVNLDKFTLLRNSFHLVTYTRKFFKMVNKRKKQTRMTALVFLRLFFSDL